MRCRAHALLRPAALIIFASNGRYDEALGHHARDGVVIRPHVPICQKESHPRKTLAICTIGARSAGGGRGESERGGNYLAGL